MDDKQVKKALELHAAWKYENPDGKRADFSNADLSGMVFENEYFSGALFRGARLVASIFKNCEICRVHFHSAILDGAHFIDCKTTGTTLGNAGIRGTKFINVTGLGLDTAILIRQKQEFHSLEVSELISKLVSACSDDNDEEDGIIAYIIEELIYRGELPEYISCITRIL